MKINFAISALCVLALVVFAACPNETSSPSPSPSPPAPVDTFTVTFDPYFGSWNGDFDKMTVEVNDKGAVAAPVPAPGRRFSSFDGWYTKSDGGERYNFAAPVTGLLTLYARWSVMFYFTDINDITTYLQGQPANNANTPLFLPVKIDLGTITAAAGSGWQQLLNAISTGGKYVALDLSTCAMTGTDVTATSISNSRIVFIAFPDAARSIADSTSPYYASRVNNLRSFSGRGLTSIGESAFEECKSLTEITLPEGLTSIGHYAFSKCTSLARLTLPAGITYTDFSFQYCTGLTQVTLSEGLTSIGAGTFLNCTGLTQITLPESLASIDRSAFSGTNLALVICRALTPPTLGTSVFPDSASNIKVPADSVEAYKAAVNWRNYAVRISAIDE